MFERFAAMHVSIVKKLKDQAVFVGESLEFEVKLSREDALGTWTHNDIPLTPIKRYKLGKCLVFSSTKFRIKWTKSAIC